MALWTTLGVAQDSGHLLLLVWPINGRPLRAPLQGMPLWILVLHSPAADWPSHTSFSMWRRHGTQSP